MLGWRNVALVHLTSGLWHDAHELPKWLDGALWHDAHDAELGWAPAQVTPGRRWHEAQSLP